MKEKEKKKERELNGLEQTSICRVDGEVVQIKSAKRGLCDELDSIKCSTTCRYENDEAKASDKE